MEEFLKIIQTITDTITKDKDYKDTYYTETHITLYNEEMEAEQANGYDQKELIYGDPDNPFTISIFKIIDEGYLCDDMPDDFDYGFHDPYEPYKEVIYVIKRLDHALTNAIGNKLEEGDK